MPAGRPPKPIEQKRRTGNPGKRALPAASNLAVVPAVEPAPLERSAAEVFSQVLADGVHWLGQTDSPTLVILREQLEEREQLRAIVMESGRNDDRKALRDLEKAIRETLSACGFDPAARTRLGLAEVKAQSKLEELRDRQHRRATQVAHPDNGA
jgi:Spy/CpxP family protein refolding chaperone